MTPATPSLTPDDWAAAALAVLRTQGPGGVKVEALARGIGATKGSFYWHFAGRPDLIRAALRRWQDEETEQIIDRTGEEASPSARLYRLFALVATHREPSHAELGLYVGTGDPDVAAIVNEVTDRRVAYVRDLLVQAGIDRDVAGRRAVVAYAAVLGMGQLSVGAPTHLPEDMDTRQALAESIVEMLLSDPTKPAEPR